MKREIEKEEEAELVIFAGRRKVKTPRGVLVVSSGVWPM